MYEDLSINLSHFVHIILSHELKIVTFILSLSLTYTLSLSLSFSLALSVGGCVCFCIYMIFLLPE